MALARTAAVLIAQMICFGTIVSAAATTTPGQSADADSVTPAAGVFVLGGIHQAHEEAKFYTYERMGQVYQHLKPDVLAVECVQVYVEDGSFTGMPFDFKRAILPFAVEDQIPIYGIDWWDEGRGEEWETLQIEAQHDSIMRADITLLGGMFMLLNEYFCEKDFRDINSDEITAVWSAKNELKYAVLRRSPEYRPIEDFEGERNDHLVRNIVDVVNRHPDSRVLVAVGIDHKYYIESALREQGVTVLSVEAVLESWWE
jgi:hypothetical protein